MSSEPFCVIEGDNPNQIYKGTIKGLVDRGDIVVSRGLETKEIHPAMIIFNRPRERFLTCPGRKIHPFFQVMESIWILAGRGDVAWIAKYLKNIEKYSDGEDCFHAPYGWRMRDWNKHRQIYMDFNVRRDQFNDCFSYLKNEPDTRHAVMSFWNPVLDNLYVKTIDRPCNITFHFLVRDNRLDLTIFNRSNDAHWGLFNANVVQFSVILETMAYLLGYSVGRQIHMIDSLHLYTDSPLTSQVLGRKKSFDVYSYVSPKEFEIKVKGECACDPGGMDICLEKFFNCEKRIWDEDVLYDYWKTGFNYLDDALILVESFYQYKVKNNVIAAIASLERVKADDMFITCFEFLTRKFKDDSIIKEVIKKRFVNSGGYFTDEITKYVLNH